LAKKRIKRAIGFYGYLMPNISEVFIVDVAKLFHHRKTKHCVCVSAGDDKFLVINSEHREMYDDFKIEVSNYSFLEKDRFVACRMAYEVKDESLIKKVGNLNYEDMTKILNKIQNSKLIEETERDSIAFELEGWLKYYTENKLKNKFGKK